MLRSRLVWIAGVCALGVASAPGQTTPPFSYRAQVGAVVQPIADGGTLLYAADALNRPLDGSLTVTYRGIGSVSLNRFELTGSTDFSVSNVPQEGAILTPNQSFTVGIRFSATSSDKKVGAFRILYTDSPPTPPGGRPVNGSTTVNLSGVAPEFTFAVVVPVPGGNAVPLNSGDTITYPLTPINTTTTAQVIVTNKGTGPGTLGAIRLSGPATLTLGSLAVPPITVDPTREFRFTIAYAPLLIENVKGSVSVELIDRTVSFNLTAGSTGPVYTYELITEKGTAPLAVGGVVTLPDVVLTDKSTVVVRVRNTGNADGKITAIGATGTGFSLTDVPFVPLTLTIGSAATLTVNFSPTAAGRATGKLRIGDDSFDLVSNGLGPIVNYAFIAGSVTTTIASGGTVSFPPVAVGQTSSVRFAISNTGTASTPVNSVGVVLSGTPSPAVTPLFAVTDLPALPASVEAGKTLSFVVTFAPNTIGNLTGTLRVDGQTFTLSGVATQPPALPAYTYTGASGSLQPAQQATVGLSLAQTYPLAVTGTLTMNFNSDVFANDPSVQFATGGRTAAFTIPAGTRDAVFSNNQTSMRLQTGTVAGTITLVPSFQSTDGAIPLTPTNPPQLNLAVANTPPQLLSVQVTTRVENGFQLLVTGYATSRQLTQISIVFAPTPGENVQTTRLDMNVDATFNAWYQSATAIPFGSQFTAVIPITIQGDLKDAKTHLDTIKSVAVTLTNRVGNSQTITTSIQ